MKKMIKTVMFCGIVLLWIPGLLGALDPGIQQVDDWEPMIPAGGDASMLSIIVSTPGNLQKTFAGYSSGEVYVTENATDPYPAWTKIYPVGNVTVQKRMVTGIAMNALNSSYLYISFEGDAAGNLIKTEDGGRTWITMRPPSPDIRGISVHPLNPEILYVIAKDTVFVSKNRGKTWSTSIADDPFQIPLETGDIISTIEQLPYDTNKVFVGTKNGQLYTCADINAEEPYWYRITNAASTIPKRLITAIAVDTHSSSIPKLYITSGHRETDPFERDSIWRSLGGGVEWENIHTDSIPAESQLCSISINPYYLNTLYICFRNQGTARSIDRGSTWTLFPTNFLINLKVRYRDGGYGMTLDNHIKPHLQIKNESAQDIPLSELTMKYWYTIDSSSPQQFWVDYAYIGNNYVQSSFVSLNNSPAPEPKEGADYYLEVSFSDEAGVIPAEGSSGELQLRFNKSDWSNYNETDDYSYMETGFPYEETQHVTLYWNDVLIWGIEP
ncbi:MAG: hypothetical protein JXJ04_12805 [Spirochaetales bacterium]|nr:hypothetical protein [Spirochaetales bacterium]